MINSYGEIDEKCIDALCEVGNTGAGNAATSLSVMIGEGVRISTPRVMILDRSQAARMIAGAEAPGIAIMVRYGGDVNGMVMFALSHEDAGDIADRLMGDMEDEKSRRNEFSGLKVSMIKEIGNIMGSAYINSVATLTGLHFDVSIPLVSIDMTGAAMDAPVAEFSAGCGKLFLVEGGFQTDTLDLRSHMVLVADVQSLNKILTKLGAEEWTGSN